MPRPRCRRWYVLMRWGARTHHGMDHATHDSRRRCRFAAGTTLRFKLAWSHLLGGIHLHFIPRLRAGLQPQRRWKYSRKRTAYSYEFTSSTSDTTKHVHTDSAQLSLNIHSEFRDLFLLSNHWAFAIPADAMFMYWECFFFIPTFFYFGGVSRETETRVSSRLDWPLPFFTPFPEATHKSDAL